MPRITVNVDEETEGWLEREADRLNWSKAEAGGHCITVLHSSVQHINPNQTDVELEGEPPGGDVRVLVDDLRERVAALEERATPAAGQRTSAEPDGDTEQSERSGGGGAVRQGAHGETQDSDEPVGVHAPRDGLRDRIEQLDLPGNGSTLERRRDAVEELVRTIYREDGADARELRDSVDYEALGYGSRTSAWSNIISKPGTWGELDDVEKPGRGAQTIRPALDGDER